MSAPAYLTYYVIGGSLLILIALSAGVWSVTAKAGWADSRHRRFTEGAVTVLAAWLVAAIVLAIMGVYASSPQQLPTVEYGLLVPIVVGLFLMFGYRPVRELFGIASQSWLVGVQTYRALGAIFLILYAAARLPGEFALPAGVGDVAIGVTAPFVAVAYGRNPAKNRWVVWLWNLLGLFDLVIAVASGVLTSPSPIQHLALDRPNVLISMFPLVLIPTYLVPISILLHIASLDKLMRRESAKELLTRNASATTP